MSLIVTALVVGGGALAAGALARIAVARRRRRQAQEVAEPPSEPRPSPLAAAGFTLEQGDVLSVGGREAWLEHGWLLSEAGRAVGALMFSRDAVVLAHPKPNPRIYWLTETELRLPSDPPTVLDHGGVRYERARRLPVEITPLDNSPQPPWDGALLSEYRGLASEALWALTHGAVCRAWAGREASASEVENWGGGRETLERGEDE